MIFNRWHLVPKTTDRAENMLKKMDKVEAHKAQLRFRKIFFKKHALVMILIFPNLNLEESYHKRANKHVQKHIQEPFSMMSDSQKRGWS